MKWVDLHNLEYGECIVLGGDDSLLMVDCGSLNTVLRASGRNVKEYMTRDLAARYSGVSHRAFLLSHYHRDHACGLWDILDAWPDYFSELYLPCTPCDSRGLPLLLEFALFAYVFQPRQGFNGQVSTGSLKAFSRVMRQTHRGSVYALGQGDSFVSGGVCYECLWPPREDYPFETEFIQAVERLHLCVESPYQAGADLLQQFLEILYAFGRQYTELCETVPVQSAQAAQGMALLNQLDDLAPALCRLPAAVEVRALLENETVRQAYSRQVNAASLIFQNRRPGSGGRDDVLFTGDTTPETLAAVEPLLYHDYYLVKVPHHGTASAVSPVLTSLSAAHLLISSGEAPQGERVVAADYASLPGMKHCTAETCAFLQVGDCCCGRTAVCWECGGLALRCPGNRGGEPPCGIRVIGTHHTGCICD